MIYQTRFLSEMSSRIANNAEPGSLLKRPDIRKRVKVSNQFKTQRKHDEGHLKAIRTLPCVVCGSSPCDAAHVRMSSAAHGKRPSGMGSKPDDSWTVPLCHEHHMEQHRIGELTFWFEVGISPFRLASLLYQVSPDIAAMRRIIGTIR